MNESCTPSGAVRTYVVTIFIASGTTRGLSITGLSEIPTSIVIAEVSLDGSSFVINRQAIDGNFDVECSKGSIDANAHAVTMTYSIYPVGSVNASSICTAVLLK